MRSVCRQIAVAAMEVTLRRIVGDCSINPVVRAKMCLDCGVQFLTRDIGEAYA